MRKIALFVLRVLPIFCGASWAQSQPATLASLRASAVPNQVRFSGVVKDANGKPLSGFLKLGLGKSIKRTLRDGEGPDSLLKA